MWLKTELIGPLFQYAICRERDGDKTLFNRIIRLAQWEVGGLASRGLGYLSALEMCTCASPQAVLLAGPYVNWEQEQSMDARDIISKWLAAISTTPHTKVAAEAVVATLLQIADNGDLRPSVPADIWLWLNERPRLLPDCKGLSSGSHRGVVRTVRALNDIGILTSYMIVIWSKSNPLDCDGFAEMRMSVREDFNGIGMGCNRAELIQQLDYVLENLDWQLWNLGGILDDDESGRNRETLRLQSMKDRYGELKRILQEVDQEATGIFNRMPHLHLSRFADLHGLSQNPTSPSCVPCLSHVRNLEAFGMIGVITLFGQGTRYIFLYYHRDHVLEFVITRHVSSRPRRTTICSVLSIYFTEATHRTANNQALNVITPCVPASGHPISDVDSRRMIDQLPTSLHLRTTFRLPMFESRLPPVIQIYWE
jgi:hypothetical protein